MRNLVGITPDYVMVTRFPFFEDMVDDIGGITVSNPRRFTDPNLKKEGFAQGRIRLGGYDAMAFSRIRNDLPGGDFDRSANQQRTLRGIHARIRSEADRPGFIERGVHDGDEAPGHRPGAGGALRARAGRGPGRARPDHHLRDPGPHRHGRRGRAWSSRTWPRPAGWAMPPVATPPCVGADTTRRQQGNDSGEHRPGLGRRMFPTVSRERLRQDSNLRHLVPETSALSPELRRPGVADPTTLLVAP